HFLRTLPAPPRSPLFPYTTLFRSPRSTSPVRAPARRGPGRGPDGRRRGRRARPRRAPCGRGRAARGIIGVALAEFGASFGDDPRSEEHTSELQSLAYLVCRLLLEK